MQSGTDAPRVGVPLTGAVAWNSTASDPPLAARAAHLASLKQPKSVLELYSRACEEADPHNARRMALLPVTRALLKMRRIDLALTVHRRHVQECAHPPDARSTCALFLALCRTAQLVEAAAMLEALERAHPAPGIGEGTGDVDAVPPAHHPADVAAGAHGTGGAGSAAGGERDADATDDEEPLWLVTGTVMRPALALAYLDAGSVDEALAVARRLCAPVQCLPPPHIVTQLVRGFGKRRCPEGVLACLEAQTAAAQSSDADGLQAIVDALVHSVSFVKGGVSMATLPSSPMPEVAFIGRSNVGKSSLVNMVLGRRAIAYTSKTPGKTQQYNYFVVNEPRPTTSRTFGGRRGGGGGGGGGSGGGSGPPARSMPSFHLVDMPGLGYAKVPGAERKKWLQFLRQYSTQRPQLRLIVHLIDGQVGPTDVDLAIMRMVRDAAADGAGGADGEGEGVADGEGGGKGIASHDAPGDLAAPPGGNRHVVAESSEGGAASTLRGSAAGGWHYAICLTKSDKGGPKALERVEGTVRRAVSEAGAPPLLDLVATSSKAKAGRAAMWRLMRRLVVGDSNVQADPSDSTHGWGAPPEGQGSEAVTP